MCVLSGFPIVGLLNAAGVQVATALPSEGNQATTPGLRLDGGQTASAQLGGSAHSPGPALTCPSYSGYTVRLRGSSMSKRFKGPLAGCSRLYATSFVLGFNGASPSGEVVGTVPPCDRRTGPEGPGLSVEVDAWLGTRLAGSTTVFEGVASARPFSLIVPPGRYRIGSPRSPSRHVVVRAGELVRLGRYGRCSAAGATPSTVTPSTTSGPGEHATTTTTPPAASPSASCGASDLELTLDRVAPALMQQPSALFRFTNTSHSACTLDGYPSVEPVAATGQIIGAAIRDSGSYLIIDPGPQTVTLAAGGSAYFGYGWSDVSQPLGTTAGCLGAVRVESIPPGSATPLTTRRRAPLGLPGWIPECDCGGGGFCLCGRQESGAAVNPLPQRNLLGDSGPVTFERGRTTVPRDPSHGEGPMNEQERRGGPRTDRHRHRRQRRHLFDTNRILA